MAEDGSEAELAAEAAAERAVLLTELPGLERAVLLQLLPSDEADDRGVVLEVSTSMFPVASPPGHVPTIPDLAGNSALGIHALEQAGTQKTQPTWHVGAQVRAGTGGDEAALFALELLRMYQRFAGTKGWRWEQLAIDDTQVRTSVFSEPLLMPCMEASLFTASA